MEDYVGKICPFCKTEIKEGDSVKVCPACGMSEPFRTPFIAKSSGVNTTATILTVVGFVLLTVTLSI